MSKKMKYKNEIRCFIKENQLYCQKQTFQKKYMDPTHKFTGSGIILFRAHMETKKMQEQDRHLDKTKVKKSLYCVNKENKWNIV